MRARHCLYQWFSKPKPPLSFKNYKRSQYNLFLAPILYYLRTTNVKRITLLFCENKMSAIAPPEVVLKT